MQRLHLRLHPHLKCINQQQCLNQHLPRFLVARRLKRRITNGSVIAARWRGISFNFAVNIPTASHMLYRHHQPNPGLCRSPSSCSSSISRSSFPTLNCGLQLTLYPLFSWSRSVIDFSSLEHSPPPWTPLHCLKHASLNRFSFTLFWMPPPGSFT